MVSKRRVYVVSVLCPRVARSCGHLRGFRLRRLALALEAANAAAEEHAEFKILSRR